MRNYLLLNLFVAALALPAVLHAGTWAVEVDTGTEMINAIEGSLVLPKGSSVTNLYTGNSAVVIWITKPDLNSSTSTIPFAGMTPGGVRGKYQLFSFEDKSNLSPNSFSLRDVKA